MINKKKGGVMNMVLTTAEWAVFALVTALTVFAVVGLEAEYGGAGAKQAPVQTVHAPSYPDCVRLDYLGDFKITVYTPYDDGGRWGYYTATPGVYSKHLTTCAVDPKVIPLGTTIKVGDLILEAVDVGSAVDGNHIDIFYDGTIRESVDWALDWGTKQPVWVVPDTMPAAFLTRKDYDEVNHLLNICNINGAEVEPFPIAITRYHFKEGNNA